MSVGILEHLTRDCGRAPVAIHHHVLTLSRLRDKVAEEDGERADPPKPSESVT